MFSNISGSGGGGGLFGSSSGATQTNTSSLFGAPAGQQTSSTLGGISPFGAPTPANTGSFFGGSSQPSTGLFGASTQAPGTSMTSNSLFGSNQTPSTGLFGAQQPQISNNTSLFGNTASGTTTSNNLFSQGTSGGLFGQPSTSSGNSVFQSTPAQSGGLFGLDTAPIFGSAPRTDSQITGTKNIRWRDENHREAFGKIQTITALPEVNQAKSVEELRWEDYRLGVGPKQQSTTPTSTQGFGTTGLFGQSNTQTASGLFGTSGTTSQNLFGSSAPTNTFGGGLLGTQTTQPSSNSGGLFGTTTSTGGGLFGATAAQKPATGLFGSTTTPSSTGLFGSQTTTSGFPTAAPSSTSGGSGLFGSGGSTLGQSSSLFPSNTPSSTSPFGSVTATQPVTTTGTSGLFGGQSATPSAGGLFGAGLAQPTTGGLFGSSTTPASTDANKGAGLFGANSTTQGPFSGGLFGTSTAPGGTGLFGNTSSTTGSTATGSQPLFGASTTPQQTTGAGLFGSSGFGTGAANKQQATSLFGTPAATTNLGTSGAGGTSLFGSSTNQAPATQSTNSLFGKPSGTLGSSLFGTNAPSPFPSAPSAGTGGLFGTTPSATGGLFGTSLGQDKTGGLLGNQTSLPVSSFGFQNTLPGSTNSFLFGGGNQPVQQQGAQANQQFMTGAGGLPGGFGGVTIGQPGAVGTADSLTNANAPGAHPSAFPYGVSGAAAFPLIMPNGFSFPTAGVILPNVYRRYKSAALAQVWRPLPEHCTSYRRQLLPSLTPKRFLRPRRTSMLSITPNVNPVQNLLDSDWAADYGLKPSLQSAAIGAAIDAGMTPPKLSSARGRLSTGSRFGSVFRSLASEDNDQSPLPSQRGWAGETTYRDHGSPHEPVIDGGVSTARYRYHPAKTVWADTNDGYAKSHARAGEREPRMDPAVGYWNNGPPPDGLTPHPGREIKQSLDTEQDGGYSVAAPWLYRTAGDRQLRGSVPCFHSSGPEARWGGGSRYSDQPPDDSYQTSRNLVNSCQGIHSTDVNNNSLTRRTGRLGLASVALSGNDAALTKRRWEAIAPLCTREGYSTKPTMETLKSYTESRLAAVEDFTVIHEGFGEITWPGLTDVRGLSIDDVVIIEDKAVEVYPETCLDGSPQDYPPIGVGLNKPALITLYNCGPKDSDEGEDSGPGSATATKKKSYELHVDKMRAFTKKIGGQFISLSPQGVWKFRVEHFSRYAYENCLIEA